MALEISKPLNTRTKNQHATFCGSLETEIQLSCLTLRQTHNTKIISPVTTGARRTSSQQFLSTRHVTISPL